MMAGKKNSVTVGLKMREREREEREREHFPSGDINKGGKTVALVPANIFSRVALASTFPDDFGMYPMLRKLNVLSWGQC